MQFEIIERIRNHKSIFEIIEAIRNQREREREGEQREQIYREREREKGEGSEGTENSESRENRERGRKREGDDITLNLDVKLFQYQLIRLWFYVNVALNIDFSGYSVTCVSLYLRPPYVRSLYFETPVS